LGVRQAIHEHDLQSRIALFRGVIMTDVIVQKKNGERRLVNNNKRITVTDTQRKKPTRMFQAGVDGDYGCLDSTNKSWVLAEFDSRTQFLNHFLYTLKGITLDVLKRLSTLANEFFHAKDVEAGKKCATLSDRLKRETVWCHLAGCRRKNDILLIDGVEFTAGASEFKVLSHFVNVRLVHSADYKPRTN
jgi:hypothetical protein